MLVAICTYSKNFFLGTAVITLEKAALWTDGRTFQSAIDDVDCGWTIYRKGTKQIILITWHGIIILITIYYCKEYTY